MHADPDGKVCLLVNTFVCLFGYSPKGYMVGQLQTLKLHQTCRAGADVPSTVHVAFRSLLPRT